MAAAFSVGGWSFHALHESGKMDFFGYLQSMKYRYRLPYADIWTGMLKSTEDDYVRSVAETLKEEGIVVASLNVDGADVWHDDPDTRENNHRKALRYLAIAREWGALNLRIDLGVHTAELSEEQWAFCVDRYREYAKFARENGFRIGPQTHQTATLVPHNLVRLNREIASPAFGVLLNVSRWPSDKAKGDELVAPFISHVQFDRAFVDFAGSELPDKIRLFHRNGYRGVWSLEFRGGKDEYLEVEHDVATLRRAVKQAIGES